MLVAVGIRHGKFKLEIQDEKHQFSPIKLFISLVFTAPLALRSQPSSILRVSQVLFSRLRHQWGDHRDRVVPLADTESKLLLPQPF